ncbi:MAG: histidine phosphatase family protein [Pseudomonadota bacterium]
MGLTDPPTPRYVRLIRHAKSADGNRDHERPLNPRGERDGVAMQQWFSQQAHPATWVWSSSALRARQTAEFVRTAFGAELAIEPTLYLGSPESLLTCLAQTPADVHSVALVAHNPGITYCANLLIGDTVTDNLVTFGTVLLSVPGHWSDIAFGGAELISLDTPKGLAQRD